MFRRRRLCAPGGVLRHAAAARPPRLPEALLQPGGYAPVRGLASCNHLSVNNASPARNILETAPNVVLHYISCLISGTCSSATPSRTTIDTSASPTPWSRYLQNIYTLYTQYLHTIYALVQVGTHFNLADGILTVPVSGVYLVSVHVLPAANKGPCINDVMFFKPVFFIIYMNHKS